MVAEIFIYNAQGTHLYENLAIETVLMDSMQPGQAMLYLWQNLNTVVIGRTRTPGWNTALPIVVNLKEWHPS